MRIIGLTLYIWLAFGAIYAAAQNASRPSPSSACIEFNRTALNQVSTGRLADAEAVLSRALANNANGLEACPSRRRLCPSPSRAALRPAIRHPPQPPGRDTESRQQAQGYVAQESRTQALLWDGQTAIDRHHCPGKQAHMYHVVNACLTPPPAVANTSPGGRIVWA